MNLSIKEHLNFISLGAQRLQKWMQEESFKDIFSQEKINRFKVQATEIEPEMIEKLGEHHEMEDVICMHVKIVSAEQVINLIPMT